ncbi:MAG: hypothetical protein KQH63_08795 [Desulfobulbaceae bacterium]|nr:hypothetical protein [Desulfobulbaceae bacterium]
MKKITVIIMSFLSLLMSSQTAYGEEYVLISHKKSPVEQLTSQEVKRIFLGKMKKWPTGTSIQIVVNINKEVHSQFTGDVLKKSPSQFSNYWRKVLFSGKSMLPVYVKNDEEAINYVSNHEDAITYINIAHYDDTFKKIAIVK